jgi:predicted short-subunit dehydrogenase-like oxidoreductase (DUF2520 family)
VKVAGAKLQKHPGVAIVGPGRVGQALGKLLAGAGVPVRYVAARRLAAARRAVRFIGSGQAVGLGDSRLAEASVLILATADSAIGEVARNLAGLRRDWSGKVALHTCGSLPASVLGPLARRGAVIGSLHPFQTIPNPRAGIRNLKRCYWGVEGDAAARRIATQYVRALHGVAFSVKPSAKTLYHLSAFLVCPTVVTLMDRSERLLRKSGVPAKIARPMLGRFVAETVRNFVELGGRRALTGPAARGDWPTLERHLAALRRVSPEFVPVYIELVRAMLRLAGRRPPRPRRGQARVF